MRLASLAGTAAVLTGFLPISSPTYNMVMDAPGEARPRISDNTTWLLSTLALALAVALLAIYLVLEASGAEVDISDKDWSLLSALGRFTLLAIPNVVVLLAIYAMADRMLQRRGLDAASRIADRVSAEVGLFSVQATRNIESVTGSAVSEIKTLSESASNQLSVLQAPLESVVNELKLAQFQWEADFLARSNEVTLVWRYGSRVLAIWTDEFADYLRGGGRLTFVLPDPRNSETIEMMMIDRPEEESLLARIDETLEQISALADRTKRQDRVAVVFVDFLIAYDIYLAHGALAIQAPYENVYAGVRCPVSICRPGSLLFDFLASETERILELGSPASRD